MIIYGSEEKSEEDHQEEGDQEKEEVASLVLIRIDKAPRFFGAFSFGEFFRANFFIL